MDRWQQDRHDTAERTDGDPANGVGFALPGKEGLPQRVVHGGWIIRTPDLLLNAGFGDGRPRRGEFHLRVHDGHPDRRGPRSARWLARAARTGSRELPQMPPRASGLLVRTPVQDPSGLLPSGVGLAVMGGRSASVAAAMIGWTLARSGRDPTVLLGRSAKQLGGWARLGAGRHLVLDATAGFAFASAACAQLAPSLAVLLEDADQTDPGAGAAAEAAIWKSLVESLPEEGLVLAHAGSTVARQTAANRGRAVQWLALERGSDWWGADLREDRGRYRFRAFWHGRFVTELRLRVPGRRNVLCALAAVASCSRLEVPPAEIQQSLEEFTGVSGEFESRGSYRGVTLIADAGIDPAAVGDALRLARSVFGKRRLWAVLDAPAVDGDGGVKEHHAAALAPADEVLLVGKGDSTAPVEPLAATGIRGRRVAGLDAAIMELDRNLEPGDVLVTLGAGDVGTISDVFIRRLWRDRPG
jgi:UDP-N-acetylmuramate--alanine ligase